MNYLPLPFEDTSVPFRNKSDKDLNKMKLLFRLLNTFELAKVGIFFVKTSLFLGIPIEKIIKKIIFSQFVGGENIESTKKTLNNLKGRGVHSILDFSSEPLYGRLNYEDNFNEIMKTIDEAAQNSSISFAVFKFSSLIDVQYLEDYSKNSDKATEITKQEIVKLERKVTTLFSLAAKKDVKIMVDAEECAFQEYVDLFLLNEMHLYNKEKAIVFNTLQMYRKDSLSRLQNWYKYSQQQKFIVAIKLVRGAYMDKERKRATQNEIPSPIHDTKRNTDNAYAEAMQFIVEKNIPVCLGTHNEEDVQWMYRQIAENKISSLHVWFAQLLGMSDHISFHLAERNMQVSKYVPYGPVKGVVPYLIRRAEENKSVMGKSSRELELIEKELERRKREKEQ